MYLSGLNNFLTFLSKVFFPLGGKKKTIRSRGRNYFYVFLDWYIKYANFKKTFLEIVEIALSDVNMLRVAYLNLEMALLLS